MPLTYRFTFPLPNGLHARPASHLAEQARGFACAIALRNETRGATADVKSVLSMVAADVRHGDPCALDFDGDDEQAAHAALSAYVARTLPTTDEALPEVAAPADEVEIPRSLAAAGLATYVRGTPVSGGVAIGTAVHVRGTSLPATIERTTALPPAAEREAFRGAVARVSAQVAAKAADVDAGHEADVLDVQRSLLGDPELLSSVEAKIADGLSAAQAVLEAGRGFVATLARSESAYLRERALDLQDVLAQLLAALGHAVGDGGPVTLAGPSICVADHLTPGQLLSMDATLLRGLVLSSGGTTSHTVILARARGIPMLVDVKQAPARVPSGGEIVVDAEVGLVAPLATDGLRRYYALEAQRLEAMRARNAESLAHPAQPIGGAALEVGANISSADEVAGTIAQGADGIGLFRTEMLFLGRDRAPTEDEQYEAYAKALADAGGRPVIIRTFDIGGDKPAPYLKLPREANPFLGDRGVRLYASQPTLIRAQLRALLRAAPHGNLKVLVPMIACVEEVRSFRAMLDAARDELIAEGAGEVAVPPVGVMIEVPSAAMSVTQLAREVDFFSIGSNDLTQYLLAADRDNPAVANLYTPLHPALWAMLAGVCRDARAAGRWVGLCGELAENAEALPLLVGLGLDEISTSATRIAGIKRRVRGLDRAACAALLDEVTRAATRADVSALLRDFGAATSAAPMLAEETIHLRSSATTKEEAIKALCDRLWVADRVSDTRLAERAIWAREATYATGFGHGCAIPHCKSAAVTASSVAVAKLARPVPWNEDGTPVDLIFMLVLREQDHGKQHMRVLAQLSRLLMRDEFRDTVRRIETTPEMLSFLNESLNL